MTSDLEPVIVAVRRVVASLRAGAWPGSLADFREDDLSAMLCLELEQIAPGRVFERRGSSPPDFPGVGPLDLGIWREPETSVALAAELKWSTNEARDKIFESAWDAVKLAIWHGHASLNGCALITGASKVAWKKTECADLFEGARIEVAELWGRRLYAPGSNGGNTVGEDCYVGGRENTFIRAPKAIATRALADEEVKRSGERWRIRAASVEPSGPIVRFAPDPEFPTRINQPWLDQHVPSMPEERFARLLDRLKAKRWTPYEIETRVRPLRRHSEPM